MFTLTMRYRPVKSKNPILFLLMGLLCLLAWPQTSFSAENKTSIENTLEQLLSNTGNPIDLTQTLILISQDWSAKIDPSRLRDELDRLTESARPRLQTAQTGTEIVNALRKTIHEEGGYRYTDNVDAQGIPVNPDELFLHGMLETRRGYCMNLSLLYLILAERLHIPLYGVALPNHFFVRYDSADEKINIETTELGTSFPDTFYKNRFGLNAESSTRFFMRNLNSMETLGAYFSNVGMAHYRNQNPSKAVFYLEHATAINTNSVEAHNNLANIYSEIGKQDQAIAHYQKALNSDPHNASTLFNLGLAYREAGETEKSLEAFLQVTQIAPDFYLAHEYLSQLYVEDKNYESALRHFKKMDALQPGKLETEVQIGTLYLHLDQYSVALDLLKKAEIRSPKNPDILHKLAETYYRMADWQQAIEQYRYLIEQEPESLEAYIQLGWTYYRQNDLKQAVLWTQRGLDQGKGIEKLHTLARMNLGLFTLLEEDYSQAQSHYLKALEIQDSEAVQGMIGDIKEAQSNNLERTDLNYFAGWIYFKAGEHAQGELLLNQYLETDPNGRFAADALALLNRKADQTLSPAGYSANTTVETAPAPEGMVLVPQGTFIMGSDHHGDDEAPEHEVFLDAYYIDLHEVNASEFAEFLNEVNNVEGYYLDNKYGTLFFDGRFHARDGLEFYPINSVKWSGAKAYCKWKGKRLPTEAEWEKAARGTDGRVFPWGNDAPTPEISRYFQKWTQETRHQVMVPVDSMPAGKSPYGLYHMAGNVKEWVDDWFDREYYRNKSSTTNPPGQIGGEFKVLKGGSWRDLRGLIYSSFRNNGYPDTRLDDYGFRCAQSAK